MRRPKSNSKKEIIVSEYLDSEITLRELGAKYGLNFRTIQGWVRAYRINQNLIVCADEGKAIEEDERALKKQLQQVQLKNELLEEILRLSKEETGIDFKKKYGTKQS